MIIIDLKTVIEKVDLFNKLYFDSKLKINKVEIIKTKNPVGRYKRIGCSLNVVQISDYYELTVEQLNSVILHELIHAYINQNNLYDNSSHGRLFKNLCSKFTNISGIPLSVKIKLGIDVKINPKYCKNKIYTICTAETSNDKIIMFKISKIRMDYYKTIITVTKLSNLKFFKSDDSIFNKFTLCKNRIIGHVISKDIFELQYKSKLIEI